MEILIVAIILAAGIILYGVFSRKKIYSEVDRLELWKIDIMNRPVTDEMAKVKDLNMTGQTEELFDRWRAQWDDIIASDLPKVEELLFDAEEAADRYRFKKAKGVLQKIEDTLHEIEEEIQKILRELQELLGSEEKNRTEMDEIRKVYKDLKKSLLVQRHSYGKAEIHFELELEDVQEKIKAYDEATKEGNYLQAREVVLHIQEKLMEVRSKMEVLPEMLIELQTKLPAQLNEIRDGYKQMKDQGYMLDHIQVDKELEQFQSRLTEYKALLEKTEVAQVQKGLEDLTDSLNTIYDLLEKEVEANHYIQTELGQTEQALQELSEDYLKTSTEIQFVKQSYQLTEQDIEIFRYIEKQVNQLVKRFTMLEEKMAEENLPYSAVREQLEGVAGEVQKVKTEFAEYRENLQTLRKDELQAREKMAEIRRLLGETGRMVKKSNLPGLPSDFKHLLEDAKEGIEDVSAKLEEKPLDMGSVNQKLEASTALVNKAFETAHELVEQAYLVEKVIQYGNRYKSRYKNAAQRLSEAEYHFRKFEYATALEQAAAVIEEIEPGSLKRIQAIIDEENQR